MTDDAIRLYKELLRKTAEKIDKDKGILLPVNTEVIPLKASSSKSEIIIPPNMTAENYQKMGITQGQRVSWETKQIYIDTLAQLFAEGYLNEEHYDNRVAWVRDAQTQQQIDFVFTDLQKPLLEIKFSHMEKQKTPEQGTWFSFACLALVIPIVIAFLVVSAITSSWGVGIFGGVLLIYSIVLRKNLRK